MESTLIFVIVHAVVLIELAPWNRKIMFVPLQLLLQINFVQTGALITP